MYNNEHKFRIGDLVCLTSEYVSNEDKERMETYKSFSSEDVRANWLSDYEKMDYPKQNQIGIVDFCWDIPGWPVRYDIMFPRRIWEMNEIDLMKMEFNIDKLKKIFEEIHK